MKYEIRNLGPVSYSHRAEGQVELSIPLRGRRLVPGAELRCFRSHTPKYQPGVVPGKKVSLRQPARAQEGSWCRNTTLIAAYLLPPSLTNTKSVLVRLCSRCSVIPLRMTVSTAKSITPGYLQPFVVSPQLMPRQGLCKCSLWPDPVLRVLPCLNNSHLSRAMLSPWSRDSSKRIIFRCFLPATEIWCLGSLLNGFQAWCPSLCQQWSV